jgi:thiol-disulfide isomerase/thioredoxin
MRVVLLLIFAHFTASAQQMRFEGTIAGNADENLRVTFPEDWFGRTWDAEIPVSGGQFSRSVDLPASGWMTIHYKDKDRQFYVWKGCKELRLKFDADFLDDKVELSGEGAAIHRFAEALKEKFESKLTVKWLEEQAKEATNIDAMEMETFRLRNEGVALLNQFRDELPDEFEASFKNHLGYYYYLSLFKFSSVKTAASNIPKATEIPNVLLDGLNWERMDRESEMDSPYFRELLLLYIQYKALEQYEFMKFADPTSSMQEAYNVARTNLHDQPLKYFLTQALIGSGETVQPSLLRRMRDYLSTQNGTSVHVVLVEEKLGDRLNAKDTEVAIIPPTSDKAYDAFDVELDGLDGKKFKLSDLRGKVVYVDIWASWCGPCRQQFPHSKELKAQLSKKELKNIEFLYISIDNTETVWKKAIEELGIEGVHAISKGGWGSEVTAKFGVNSIPRYFIFDKNGRVIDQNAPRPSDPTLLEILRKLIAQ